MAKKNHKTNPHKPHQHPLPLIDSQQMHTDDECECEHCETPQMSPLVSTPCDVLRPSSLHVESMWSPCGIYVE